MVSLGKMLYGVGTVEMPGEEKPDEFLIDYAPPYVRRAPPLIKTTSPLDLRINSSMASLYRAQEFADTHISKYPNGVLIGQKVAASTPDVPHSSEHGYSVPSLTHALNARGNSLGFDNAKIQRLFMNGGPITDRIYEENRVGTGVISDNHEPIFYATPTSKRNLEITMASTNKIMTINQPIAETTMMKGFGKNIINHTVNKISNIPIHLNQPMDTKSKNLFLQQIRTTPIIDLLGGPIMYNNVSQVEKQSVQVKTNIAIYDPQMDNYRSVKIPEREANQILMNIQKGAPILLAVPNGETIKVKDYSPILYRPNKLINTVILAIPNIDKKISREVELFMINPTQIQSIAQPMQSNITPKERKHVETMIISNKWSDSITPQGIYNIPKNIFRDVKYKNTVTNLLQNNGGSINNTSMRNKPINYKTILPGSIAQEFVPTTQNFGNIRERAASLYNMSITPVEDTISPYSVVMKDKPMKYTNFITEMREDRPFTALPNFHKQRDLTQKQFFTNKINNEHDHSIVANAPRNRDKVYATFTEPGYGRKPYSEQSLEEISQQMKDPVSGISAIDF